LIMIESFSRRWICSDNGVPSSLIPAYDAFRAVYLDRGEHHVECRFPGIIEEALNKFSNMQ